MKEKDEQWEELYLFAKGLVNNGFPFAEIEEALLKKTSDALLVQDVLKHAKTLHYAIKRKNGT